MTRHQPLPPSNSNQSSEGQGMTDTLAEKNCTPCRGGIAPLTHEEAERFQSQTPIWELRPASLRPFRPTDVSNAGRTSLRC